MFDIIRVIPLLLIALPLCLSIDCYKCRECSSDRSIWKTEPKCGACFIETTYFNNQVTRIDRKCIKKCVPLEKIVAGNGSRIECCYEDLCNSASSSDFQILLSVLLIALVTARIL